MQRDPSSRRESESNRKVLSGCCSEHTEMHGGKWISAPDNLPDISKQALRYAIATRSDWFEKSGIA